jgi:DNA-binding transcriptional MerR regulator
MAEEIKDFMQEFSIKDLENYTGVKAHTIRIWEQRYGLLKPMRTDSNIRKYSDKELKTLLNISLLNHRGHKISEIARMPQTKISELIEEYSVSSQNDDTIMATLKLAMLNFDEKLFCSVVDLRIATHGLEYTFLNILAPFLREIGVLWMSSSICPAQEHFISNLIRQKLYAQTNRILPDMVSANAECFVLFLPEMEFHEISLLMLNYSLRSRGYKTIYLGQSVPLADLYQVYQRVGPARFVTIITTHPNQVLLDSYLGKIRDHFSETGCAFHISGPLVKGKKSPEIGLFYLYEHVGEFLKEYTPTPIN